METRPILTKCLFYLLFLYMALCPAANGTIIYVDDDAMGLNDGSSWENAYTFLQDALVDANSVEKHALSLSNGPVEIRVAQGTYKPNQGLLQIIPPSSGIPGRGIPSPGVWPADLGIRASFNLINNVTIKGGYAGLVEPDLDARDIELFETILSGDLNGDDIEVEVNDPFDLLDEPTRSDNSMHVVTSSDNDSNAVLDGFTITGGWNTSIAFGGRTGGAGMLIYSGNPTIKNCIFTGNAALGVGGGLFNISSNPILINCIFTGNYAELGAGMFNGWVSPLTTSHGSNPTLINCTFNDNYAYSSGGGIYNQNSNPNLTNCTFNLNYSPGSGGGMYNTYSDPVLIDCTFSKNTGGSGGGMYSKDNTGLSLTNCTFMENVTEGAGGGMCNLDSNDIILKDCTFSNNSARINGGGILNSRSSMTLMNCIFTGNKACGEPWPHVVKGGGLYAYGDTTLTNCNFAGNWAQQGCAIFKYSFSNLKLTNCILWNGGNEIYQTGIKPDITYSNIQEGWEGEGNIDEDPLFANPGYWADVNDPNIVVEPNDPNAVWINGDYHLKSQAGRFDPNSGSWVIDEVTSPCIDAGDPNSPVGDEPFPNGGIVNMGAYGGTAEASKSEN